jgi:hypothetical protein
MPAMNQTTNHPIEPKAPAAWSARENDQNHHLPCPDPRPRRRAVRKTMIQVSSLSPETMMESMSERTRQAENELFSSSPW